MTDEELLTAAAIRLPSPPRTPRPLTPEQLAHLETKGACAAFCWAWRAADEARRKARQRELEAEHTADTTPCPTRPR